MSEDALAGLKAEGWYYDGQSARAQAVSVGIEGHDLVLATLHGTRLAAWPLGTIVGRRGVEAEDLVLSPDPDADARLVIAHVLMIRVLKELRPDLMRRPGRARPIGRALLWGGGAVASAVLIIGYLIPALAAGLAPMIPPERERALGDATARQIALILGAAEGEDDGLCHDPEGRAALATMTTRLAAVADLPYPVRVDVLDHGLVNAVAMPGGRIMIFRGLIERAESAEEVAGVLAHEMGHVVHHDPTTGALRAAGTAGILSMMLGDVFGAGIAAAAGEAMLNARYQREVEARADREALSILEGSDLSAAPFAGFFERLHEEHGATPALLAYFASHPALKERAERARAAGDDARGRVLSEREWDALQRICG